MANIVELGIEQRAQAPRVPVKQAIVVFSKDIRRAESIAESPLVDDDTRETNRRDLQGLLAEVPPVHHPALRSGRIVKIARDYTGQYDLIINNK